MSRVGAASGPSVGVKRAYDPPSPSDGHRVLVDRLWPRGASKERLALAAWLKGLAPSDALRRWFAHDPARWEEFAARYREELRSGEAPALLDELSRRAREGAVTLVYAARDVERNNAVILRDEIARRAAATPLSPRR